MTWKKKFRAQLRLWLPGKWVRIPGQVNTVMNSFSLVRDTKKEHQVYSKLGGKRTSRWLHVPRGQLVWGQSESNLFWWQNKQPMDCKQGSPGTFQDPPEHKGEKGNKHCDWSPCREASFDREVTQSSLQIFMTSKWHFYNVLHLDISRNFLKPDPVIPELLENSWTLWNNWNVLLCSQKALQDTT